MTVALDASSSTGATGQTADASWTHTPVGTPKGVIVLVSQVNGGGSNPPDQVVGITYGGVALTRLTTTAVQKTGDGVRGYAYFLGSSIPTGAQTVAVDVNSSGAYAAFAWTVTADTDTEIVDWEQAAGNMSPGATAELNLASRTCFVVEVWASEASSLANTTPKTGWTSSYEVDFGVNSGGSYKYDTIGSANVTPGTSTSDMMSIIGLAVSEVVGGAPTLSDYQVTGITATSCTATYDYTF